MKRFFFFAVFFLTASNLFGQFPRPPMGGFQDGPVNDETYLAWSEDGLNWNADPEPVFEHASVPDILVRSNGEFLLYWIDFSKMGDEPIEFIGFSSSQDGRSWAERDQVLINGLSAEKAVDPCVEELENGDLRMYYFGAFMPMQGGSHQIFSAISRDGGRTFIEEESIRFEAPQITDPDVVQKPDGTWIMYLSQGTQTLIATSRDGLHFEDTGVIVYGGGVPGAAVLDDGRVRLYVTSRGGIRSLISDDGISFTLEPGVRISSTQEAPIVADPSVGRAGTGQWVMAFKRRPASRHF